MTHKERFDQHAKLGFTDQTDLQRVEQLIDMLINWLYIPVEDDYLIKVDNERLVKFGINKEPINWGSLRCCEVLKDGDGVYLATIDEASPNECPTFCAYIEKYMRAWGWVVNVKTEW